MKFPRPLALMADRPFNAGKVMPMAQWEETPRHAGHATITLTRSSSHPALSCRAADPIVVAASIVVALQTVANGDTGLLDTVAVDIEALQADQAADTSPEWALLELRVRARSPEQQAAVAQRIQVVVQAQADRYGYTVQITWATEHQGDGTGRAAHN